MKRHGLSCSILVLAAALSTGAQASSAHSGAYASASASASTGYGVTLDAGPFDTQATTSQQCYHYGNPVPCDAPAMTGNAHYGAGDDCYTVDPCAAPVEVYPAPVAQPQPVVHAPVPHAPAPHVAAKGWSPKIFLGVRAGVSALNTLEFDATPITVGKGGAYYAPGYTYTGYGYAPKSTVGNATTIELDAETGYMVGAEIGVEGKHGWRAKVEYLRLENDIDPTKFLADGATVATQGGFVTVEKAFANHSVIRPYVGIGAGLLDIDLGNLDAETEIAGAVKLSAGIGVQLHHNIEGFAEYAYVYAPGVSASDDTFDYEFDYGAHTVGAGVRLSFH